mmetsp:Transcript_1219/g.2713  ORF Transcript_1219/g.2713 Transcript_1219/m.2713 type:complete len:211 (+) Transcript_1219:556-1188(+)
MHKEPAALLVLDVSPYLANLLGSAIAIKIVVLRLKVDAHDHQDVTAIVVLFNVCDACHNHAQGNRGVKRVERSLVLHDQRPPLLREICETEIHAQRVQQLTTLCLEGRLQEQIHKLSIVRLCREMTLQNLVHDHLDHEGIIDCNLLHVFIEVPALLSSASVRVVHKVVCNKEPPLKPLDAPAENRKTHNVIIGRRHALCLQYLHAAFHHH